MEPFPPELIAQIATKLFREGSHNSVASSPSALPHAFPVPSLENFRDRLPTVPGMPAIPARTVLPESSIPAGEEATSSMPRSHVPSLVGLNSHAPHSYHSEAPNAIPVNSDMSAMRQQYPPNATSAAVAPTAVKPMTLDGLKNFVYGVRNQPPVQRSNFLGGEGSRISTHSDSGMVPRHASHGIDIASVRNDFPVLRQNVNGHPLAWLDNAATTQKPQVVIDAISRFYATDNSNIHRAAHSLAARATDAYESARQTVARFIGARSDKDIVFTRGTTEAINLVANTYGHRYLKKGDEILLSMVEHHANIVPWQMIAKRKGAVIRVIPVDDRGEIIIDEYIRLLSSKTRIVGLTHASNSLGTILPVAELAHMAKRYGARVLVDGAQSISHMPINVQAMGCDFFSFSGHKIFGPTGIGALYIAEELHDVLPPWQGGGNMIRNVTFEKTTYSEAPSKFEAGTPNIADAIGLKAALDYVSGIGLSNIAAHEHALLHDATQRLSEIPGLRIIGTAREKVSVISFVLDGHLTEDVGKALDRAGIAVRSGHHCAQPSLRRFGVETTVRPSFSIYNTHDEVSRLVAVVRSLARK
ncbi:MAG: cysteine desulfurase [Planctomycetota bacterium]|nr:cysteine desulfurase [Planctomycetota bacterium]